MSSEKNKKFSDDTKKEWGPEIVQRIVSLKGNAEDLMTFLERIGLPYSTYSDWKRGRRFPTDDKLYSLCEGLGTSFSWIKFGSGGKSSASHSYQSFKEWLLPLTKKIPAPPGVDESPEANALYSARFFFWIELADTSEDYKPGIPAAEFAELLGASLDEIEALIQEPLEDERANAFIEKIDALGLDTESLKARAADIKEAMSELHPVDIPRERKEERAKKKDSDQTNAHSDLHPIFAEIPKWNVKLAAGGGYIPDIEEIEERYAFRREWLHKKTSSQNNLVMFDITGDSMEPIFSGGDVCLVDQGEKTIKSGSYYALRLGDAVHIKKLQRVKGKVKILSLNKSYKPITINPKEDSNNFEVLGRVLWVGKEF